MVDVDAWECNWVLDIDFDSSQFAEFITLDKVSYICVCRHTDDLLSISYAFIGRLPL